MAINIAIMGFGTVGSGVAETLDINRETIAKRVGEEINLISGISPRANSLISLHTMQMRSSTATFSLL